MNLLIFNLEMILRIILALISGGLIGLERENRNKDAGIRTHALVSIGAALAMIISKYGFGDTAGADASRVAAQVISGIGFIGAGVIFVKRNVIIRGLTTAAGLWVTASIAMAFGAGMYWIGGVATLLVFVFQFGLQHHLTVYSKPRRATIKLHYRDRVRTTHIIDSIIEMKVRIIHEKIFHDFEKNRTSLHLDIEIPHDMTVRQLQEFAGSFVCLTSFECSVYD